MPAILVAVWEVLCSIGAWLVEMMPWLGRALAWVPLLFPMLADLCRKFAAWLFASTLEELKQGLLAMAVRVAVMVAWGTFLAVVTTGIFGLSLREVAFNNPFSGFPAGMMFLVASAFPIKFSLALLTSYIIWRWTVYQAALIMLRTVKFLFGA